MDASARRFARKAADAALELLYPTRCVGCEMPGELICDECREALPWIEQRCACPVCGAAFGSMTCTGCEGDWEPRATVAALGFSGAAARMATCLKDYHELRLAPVNAAAMLCALEEAAFWPAFRRGERRRRLLRARDGRGVRPPRLRPHGAHGARARGTAGPSACRRACPRSRLRPARPRAQRPCGQPRRDTARGRGRVGAASFACRRRGDHRRLHARGDARPSCPRGGGGHRLLACARVVAGSVVFRLGSAPYFAPARPLARDSSRPRKRSRLWPALFWAAVIIESVLLRSVVAGRTGALSPR